MPMRPGMYPQAGDDRLFFPFLTGALVGGAAVGLTRPRPIYNVGPQGGYGYGPGPYYQPGAPFYNNSYSYYVPYRPY
ncbi:MAG: hypothetical protein K2M17_04930 [Bacilli bacterium]|nr:hypothetical protein [Bacilli bacterium]